VTGPLETLRILFGTEKIEDLPSRHIDPFRRGLLGWLFGREELPRDEPPLRRGKPLLSWLFGRDELPVDPPREPPSASPPFLATIFARERLARGEGHAAGGGARRREKRGHGGAGGGG